MVTVDTHGSYRICTINFAFCVYVAVRTAMKKKSHDIHWIFCFKICTIILVVPYTAESCHALTQSAY